MKKIKINNIFPLLPHGSGAILACEMVAGEALEGDRIIFSDNAELLILKIERNPKYREFNIIVDEKDTISSNVCFALIGNEFYLKE